MGLPQNDLVLSSNKMNDIEEVERKIANDYDVSFSQTFSQTTLKLVMKMLLPWFMEKFQVLLK